MLKNWLKQNGFPHARFAEVAADGDLVAGIRRVGLPCVVKTADFGYDGKGQLKVMTEAAVPAALQRFAGHPVVGTWNLLARLGVIRALISRMRTSSVEGGTRSLLGERRSLPEA